jgi:hypothetical protein
MRRKGTREAIYYMERVYREKGGFEGMRKEELVGDVHRKIWPLTLPSSLTTKCTWKTTLHFRKSLSEAAYIRCKLPFLP